MKLFAHLSTFCTHQFIPESEIQTVIGIEFFVMIMMMRRVNPQFSKTAFAEGFRIHFDIQMIDHAAESHQDQIKQQHININRNHH